MRFALPTMAAGWKWPIVSTAESVFFNAGWHQFAVVPEYTHLFFVLTLDVIVSSFFNSLENLEVFNR